MAGAVVGEAVRIGRNSVIGPNVVVENCDVGDNVVIKPGARIGQDGFGWTPTPEGSKKKPQELRVLLEDNVEIGANSCVDRGSWRDTIIRKGTKIDNQVQIGHNVHIGEHCLIAAQCGIAGSVTMGAHVHMGGQAGIKDHVSIGAGARIAARAVVLQDVNAKEQVGGFPAIPLAAWKRYCAVQQRQAQSGTSTPPSSADQLKAAVSEQTATTSRSSTTYHLSSPPSSSPFPVTPKPPKSEVVSPPSVWPVTKPHPPVFYFSTRVEPHCMLSRFSLTVLAPFLVQAKQWPTVTHYFEAQKFAGTELEEELRREPSPTVVAAKSAASAHFVRDDWAQVRDEVMYTALKAKFSLRSDLKDALLSTENTPLVYRDGDNYWCTGPSGKGQNKLGELLMTLRKELQDAGETRRALPPPRTIASKSLRPSLRPPRSPLQPIAVPPPKDIKGDSPEQKMMNIALERIQGNGAVG